MKTLALTMMRSTKTNTIGMMTGKEVNIFPDKLGEDVVVFFLLFSRNRKIAIYTLIDVIRSVTNKHYSLFHSLCLVLNLVLIMKIHFNL